MRAPEDLTPPFPVPGGDSSSALAGRFRDPTQGPGAAPRARVVRSSVTPGPPLGPLRYVLGGAAVLLIFLVAKAWRRSRTEAVPPPHTAPTAGLGSCEVRQITVAFDWGARAPLQARLKELAAKHDFTTAQGMKLGAAETLGHLREHVASARYAAWQTERATPDGAEAAFSKRTIDLRARFEHELVRQKETQDGPAMRARADEGRGLVVVSAVIGSTIALPRLREAPSREALPSVLRAIDALAPEQLVAFEIIWSPAAEDDRMSSYELERLYPELRRLDDDPELGGVACAHCGAPFPAEIGACPACGAPRPDSGVARLS
ncbi:MAG: DUF1517 domain-containing protein [Sandaracinaceae bacterium]|nr:DUF1517 domain-containing protein [Sandaracinaceae bacterium]